MSLKILRRFVACAPLLFACQKAPSDAPAKTEPAKTASPAKAPASAPAGAASAPAGAASAPAAGKVAPFSGLVKLGEGISPDSVKPTDVLFVMARQSHGGRPGMLVAVQRHGGLEFPKRYEMSQSNVMMPDIPFAGPFRVYARLDRDGDPMTKTKDDLYANFEADVKNGQEGVHLVLKKGSPPPAPRPMAPTGHPGASPGSAPASPASQPAK